MSLSLDSVIIQRNTDILGVVDGSFNSKVSMQQIVNASSSKLPGYAPDNASVILTFHTASKVYILGPVRTNKALHETGKEVLTKDGTLFPLQISAAIGGRYTETNQSFRSAVIDRLYNKMYISSKLEGVENSQEVLVYGFGRVLYELSTGQECPTSTCVDLPNTIDVNVQRILSSILSTTGDLPTLNELINDP